jgi:hypothetical protein
VFSLYCALFFCAGFCHAEDTAAAAQANRELLRKELVKALEKKLEDLKANNAEMMKDFVVKEFVEEKADQCLAEMSVENLAKADTEAFAAYAERWGEGWKDGVETWYKERAEKIAKRQKEEDEKRTKRLKSGRWLWKKDEWKKVLKTEGKITEVQGYLHKVLNSSCTGYEDKTDFPDRKFYKYEKEQYTVWSDLSPRFTSELAIYFDRFVEVFPKIFPIEPHGNARAKLVVVVFSDRSQYKEMLADRNGKSSIGEWSRGVFFPVETDVGWPEFTVYSYFYDYGSTEYDTYAYDYDAEGNPVEKKVDPNRKGADASVPANFSNFPHAVVQHEATHAMLRKYVGNNSWIYKNGKWIDRFPIFLNEACATLFQNFDLHLSESKNLKRTAALCNDRFLVAKYLKKNGDMPFNLKEKMDMVNGTGKPGTWAPDDGGMETAMNYATAQTFAHYLLTRSSGRKLFREMMDKIYGRKEVLEASDYKKVEKGWNKHIREVILKAVNEEGESASVHDLKVDEEEGEGEKKENK